MGVRSTLQIRTQMAVTRKRDHRRSRRVWQILVTLTSFHNFWQNRVTKLKRGEIKGCNALKRMEEKIASAEVQSMCSIENNKWETSGASFFTLFANCVQICRAFHETDCNFYRRTSHCSTSSKNEENSLDGRQWVWNDEPENSIESASHHIPSEHVGNGAKHSLLHIDLGKSFNLDPCLDLWCF